MRISFSFNPEKNDDRWNSISTFRGHFLDRISVEPVVVEH